MKPFIWQLTSCYGTARAPVVLSPFNGALMSQIFPSLEKFSSCRPPPVHRHQFIWPLLAMKLFNPAALAALLFVGVCFADSEPLEPPPVTIDPGSDTEVIEELPNSDAEVPPDAPTVTPYSCTGRACCDYTCDDADAQAFCVRTAEAGFFVPDWWITNFGFGSCTTKVTENYDTSVPCSEALPVLSECGLDETHACGYGLVCAAKNIGFAQCLPICGDRFPEGLQSPGLSEFYLHTITSGCTADGQSGTVNMDGAIPLSSCIAKPSVLVNRV